MDSRKRSTILAALVLITAHYASSQESQDYDGDDYYDGSCSFKTINCATGSICTQNPEHTRFKCECPPGYQGDGYLEEFKPGATGCSLAGQPVDCTSSDDCNQYASCKPNEDDNLKSHCVCHQGFTGTGDFEAEGCVDIEECKGNPCAQNANCTERPGSYMCQCDTTRNFEGDGFTNCTKVCYSHQDCALNARCQDDRTCKCDSGYTGDGTTCIDVDECQSGEAECPQKSTCVNTKGSYECSCSNGYQMKDGHCVPYFKTCHEMFKANGSKLTDGRYVVDLDGEGPLTAVEVDCVVLKTIAITEIELNVSFPKPIPSGGGQVTIQYPVNPQALINNSNFCSQRVWLECTQNFNGGMIQWEDASGVRREGWGGTQEGMCTCGEMHQCKDGCRCGFGGTGVDEGIILNKEQLPLSKVIFPSSSGDLGKYNVGKLRCGPASFGIPRDCQDAKFQHGVKENKEIYIDIDQEGPYPPFLVYCNQTAYSHVGIIEIPADKMVISNTTEDGDSLEYLLNFPDIEAVIKGSLFCSQRIEYQCSSETMNDAGVKVTTTSGVLNYFPGGTNDQPGSCACGLTNSCENTTFQCNCNIGDGKNRSDIGLIIDKSKLPVLKVASISGDNLLTLGPLQCSRYQFGIQPNCEKYRQADITQSYSYQIDPDGPGYLDPFTVECEIDRNKGVSVVNNENSTELDLSSGESFTIKYLAVTPAQVEALKGRSTACVQDVTFTNCDGGDVSIENITYNQGRPLSDVLTKPCNSGTSCKCGVPLIATVKDKLPIYEIRGGSATVSVGPLKCSEIFPNCESYTTFVKQEGVPGETRIASDVLTIDPDGAGGEEPFVVRCLYKETTIEKPTTTESPQLRVKPGSVNPGKYCFEMKYNDVTGASISPAQLTAMVGSSNQCAQSIRLSCENAKATGMVSYKTCGGTEIQGLVSDDVDATCSCGATGTCTGSPEYGCNCDTSTSNRTIDENLIVNNNRLPICEVCIELEDTAGTGAGEPDQRYMRIDVSTLRCGQNIGFWSNCQMYRKDDSFKNLQEEVFKSMWFHATGKPIMVGCKFFPDPQYGELVIRPTDPVQVPGKDFQNGSITIKYTISDIGPLKEAAEQANYCTQDIIFFCADQMPTLTGDYGLSSQGDRLQTSDYELRNFTQQDLSRLCGDARFAEQCTKCPNPKRLTVINKEYLPLTNILLPSDSGATVGIDDTKCAYIEKDCDAILKKNKVQTDLQKNGYYLIDPDQAGSLKPFLVQCNFIQNQGITQIPTNSTWTTKGVGGGGGVNGTDFTFKLTYPTATPDQIRSLVQNSDFCWQGVKYQCTGTPLINDGKSPSSYLTGFGDKRLTNFGTADESEVTGCACGVLGTCAVEGDTCNCDSEGATVDQGFITGKDVLPVTGFQATLAPGGYGNLTVTNIRCGPSPVDIPRDCAEAYEFGVRNGINFRQQGDILISPDHDYVRPFLVYCDYSIDPLNPVTRVKPKPIKEKPVGEDDLEVPYQGPSDEQLLALTTVSTHCYQPVKVNCHRASFIGSGVRFAGVSGVERTYFSSGTGDSATCTCGSENLCGGTKSRTAQDATNCNCDVGDEVWRSDAAILQIDESGPLRTLYTAATFNSSEGRLNLTVGDVYCARKPLEFDECSTGFNDCAPEADCIDETDGYRCECPPGWQGRVSRSANPDPPMANGRQCIDDQECTLSNRCRYTSVCVNTPGSYRCDCKQGYRNTDDFTCVDIDECQENTDDCDINARCVNTNGAFRCRCFKGFRGSGRDGDCHPVGQCSCFGDPHCLSFDGLWNHYQGLCSYVMAENHCGSSGIGGVPKFRVITQNWDHGHEGSGQYAWVKNVTIEVYNKTIVLGQNRTINVDGVAQSSYRLLSEDKSSVLILVVINGFKVELSTLFGLEMTFDGDDGVSIVIPTSMKNSTCGMCGNFNTDPEDDWIIGPQCLALAGQVTTRETLFGNSWSSNPDTCEIDCDPPEPKSTCDWPVDQVNQVCNKIFNDNSPFATGGCLGNMSSGDLDAFNFSCHYDLCHTDDLGTFCDVAEALANFCSELLADGFSWRSDNLCGDNQCGKNQEYLVCGPDAEPTCLSQDPVPIDQCQEKCYCKEGFLREGEQCLEPEDCGCSYEEIFLRIREERLVENCTKTVTCADHQDLREVDNSCAKNEACQVDDAGVMSCTPIPTTTPAPTTTPTERAATSVPEPVTETPDHEHTETPVPVPAATSAPKPVTETPDHEPTETSVPVPAATSAPEPVTETPEDEPVETPVPVPAATSAPEPVTETPDHELTETPDPVPAATSAPESVSDSTESPVTESTRIAAPDTTAILTSRYTGESWPIVAPSLSPEPIRDTERPCSEVGCDEPNTECVDGECLCKMGYTADCQQCVDINECEIGEHNCIHLGQRCENTAGSYACNCLEGFVKKDEYCHDINECEDPTTDCGPHAECRNMLGTYHCACCMGYSKFGDLCRRDTRLDQVYGAPGEECCACSGDLCLDSQPVCGTDGKTYANYAAMVVAGCRDSSTVEVNYQGNCQNSCESVICDKPFQTCSQSEGFARCSCPDCSGITLETDLQPVCASNAKLYVSECIFRLSMCETGRFDVQIEDSLELCGYGNGHTPVGPWGKWTLCSNPCGRGTSTRSREALEDSDYVLVQTAVCYTFCEQGPCRNDTCHNPGQVCQKNAVTGEGECVCPDCTGFPEEPVCGLVGNMVRTYDSACLLKRRACELTKTFQLLETRACEDKPPECGVIRNFAKLKDADNCVTSGSVDLGFCYGGCGVIPGKCCRPDTSYTVFEKEIVDLIYTCPDGSTRVGQEEVINSCQCIEEPQHSERSRTSLMTAEVEGLNENSAGLKVNLL